VKLTVAHDGEGKGRVARRALSLFWLGRAQEKTELEEQRVALVGEVQSYRTKIKQLEDDLLFRLSNSQARRPGPRACRGPVPCLQILAATRARLGRRHGSGICCCA